MNLERRPVLTYFAGAGIVALLPALCAVVGVVAERLEVALVLLVVAVIAVLHFKDFFSTPVFVAIPTGAFAIVMLFRVLAFERGRVVTEIEPKEAPRHPEASAFIFTGGRARMEYIGAIGGTKKNSYYAAAPFVGEGWTKAEPVPAWVTCINKGCEDEWNTSHQGGLRLSVNVPSFAGAVASAERRHGLRSVQGAPLLELVADPHEKVQRLRLLGVIAVVLGQAVWAIICIARIKSVWASLSEWVTKLRSM